MIFMYSQRTGSPFLLIRARLSDAERAGGTLTCLAFFEELYGQLNAIYRFGTIT